MPDPGAAARSTDEPAVAISGPDADDAFGRVLIALQPRLRAFVANLQRAGSRPCGVDDIVQETLVRAWRSRDSFDARRGAPLAWALRIAFRAFLDDRDARRPTDPLDRPLEEPSPGPQQRATAREYNETLLQQLSGRERDVLLRFHRDGQRIAAIAAALGLPVGTVKSDLHRARARLWALEAAERRSTI